MERLKFSEKIHKALVGGIRKAFHLSGMHNAALKLARIGWGKYICGLCHEECQRKNIQVDHIDAVTDVTDNRLVGYDYLGYIKRMFDPENLMVVCRPCHVEKSNKENEIRRKNREDSKE